MVALWLAGFLGRTALAGDVAGPPAQSSALAGSSSSSTVPPARNAEIDAEAAIERNDSVRFTNESASHYYNRIAPLQPEYFYFPPDPPPLGTALRMFYPAPKGMPAPPELAAYVGEPFYPILGIRLAAEDLPRRLQAGLAAYRAAKVDLQNELRSRIARLTDADAATRQRELAALARKMPGGHFGGAPTADSLLGELNRRRETVQGIYERVIHAQQPAYYTQHPAAPGQSAAEIAADPLLGESGVSNLVRFLDQRAPAFAAAIARARFGRLRSAFEHLLEALIRRDDWLRALNHDPVLCGYLLDIFQHSPYFAEQLVRTPDYFEELRAMRARGRSSMALGEVLPLLEEIGDRCHASAWRRNGDDGDEGGLVVAAPGIGLGPCGVNLDRPERLRRRVAPCRQASSGHQANDPETDAVHPQYPTRSSNSWFLRDPKRRGGRTAGKPATPPPEGLYRKRAGRSPGLGFPAALPDALRHQ